MKTRAARRTGHGLRPQLELLETRDQPSAGALDLTFGAGGIALTNFGPGFAFANAVAMQPDDKIVVAGAKNSRIAGPGLLDFALARYNPNGSLDPTFSFDGKVATHFSNTTQGYLGATAVAIEPNGKIVAGGSNGDDFALARYNPDGALDLTFGANGNVLTDFGYAGESITAMAIVSGKIVVAGF